MAGTYNDFVQASRQWIRRPGHTFAVVLCLALGLAVPIATLSIVTSLLYGDQPGIPNRRDMVRIYLRFDQNGQPVSTGTLSLDDFAAVRNAGPSLGPLAAEGKRAVAVSTKDGPVAVLSA